MVTQAPGGKHARQLTCPLQGPVSVTGQDEGPGSLALCRLSVNHSVDFEIDSSTDLQISTQLSRHPAPSGEAGRPGSRAWSQQKGKVGPSEVLRLEGGPTWEVCRVGAPGAEGAPSWAGHPVGTAQEPRLP